MPTFVDRAPSEPEAAPFVDCDECRFYPVPGGKVYISDKDVREIQLAKSAIAARCIMRLTASASQRLGRLRG